MQSATFHRVTSVLRPSKEGLFYCKEENMEFTYQAYDRLCKAAKETGKVMNYKEAATAESFLILRHDIEFSVRKAYRMAEIEASHGLSATYFVQIGNNAYNGISDENAMILREIHGMGHDIGLHYRQNENNAELEIPWQAGILEAVLGIPIDSFSCHRARGDYDKIRVDGMINAYAEPFFYRTDSPETAPTRYVSDSKYLWRFGEPEDALSADRAQLLTHPFQWGDEDRDLESVFSDLRKESQCSLFWAFKGEYARFAEIERKFICV